MPEVKKFRIAIFASGQGTNAEAIMRYFENSDRIRVVLLLTNNEKAGALERAKKFGVKVRVFDRILFRESSAIVKWLADEEVTHIVLAGFLWLVPHSLLRAFPKRIINIHPALLPKFGGKGMYGGRVHEMVKASSEKETGITIHEVNELYDDGKILFQAVCPVHSDDTVEAIAEKVHALEHANYAKAIEKWILGQTT